MLAMAANGLKITSFNACGTALADFSQSFRPRGLYHALLPKLHVERDLPSLLLPEPVSVFRLMQKLTISSVLPCERLIITDLSSGYHGASFQPGPKLLEGCYLSVPAG